MAQTKSWDIGLGEYRESYYFIERGGLEWLNDSKVQKENA
jgi:hypothetical protein